MGGLEVIGAWLRDIVAFVIVMSIATALVGGVVYLGSGAAIQDVEYAEVESATEGG